MDQDLMLVTQLGASISYVELGSFGYSEARRQDDERTSEFMRYAMFGGIHRAGRFIRECVAVELLQADQAAVFTDFFERSAKVRNAYEHFEDVIMDRPRGEKHKEIREISNVAMDATSQLIVGTETTFGNLIDTVEIRRTLPALVNLYDCSLINFASRHGFPLRQSEFRSREY